MVDTRAQLAALARQRRLPVLGERLLADAIAPSLAEVTIKDEAIDLSPRLQRRGPAPELIEDVLERFADRPLERGLAAWDILRGAIVSDDERARLLGICRPIRPLCEAVKQGHTAKAPLERFVHGAAERWQGATQPLLDAAVATIDLSAMWFEREHLTVGMRNRLLETGRGIDLGHLPALAQAHFRLGHLLGDTHAGPQWIESLIDEGATAAARAVHEHTPDGGAARVCRGARGAGQPRSQIG